ncbi:uncharacterized protein F58A4.6 [Phlebotomus argentipes]|uniref:uncharacterized protein F58A4.6 n=1 Tax=Phlebotomus argentipes TaxID=94469 RepID=UPI0028937126|nr:uncharacterized protein F58A4.6 [Phlebotomus argentipes]
MQRTFYVLDQNSAVDVYIIKRRRVRKCAGENLRENASQLLEVSTVFHANGYEIHHFLLCLATGWQSRAIVSGNLDRFSRVVVQVKDPAKNFIDFRGCRIACQIAWERAELDNLLSWFSTLGGAFSSLGDDFEHCAHIAGQISMKQLKIALKLGDPHTIARCKLYFSISLIQRGRLRSAKYLIREQYAFAMSSPQPDERLVRMCLGIWAKLQYTHAQREVSKAIKH